MIFDKICVVVVVVVDDSSVMENMPWKIMASIWIAQSDSYTTNSQTRNTLEYMIASER